MVLSSFLTGDLKKFKKKRLIFVVFFFIIITVILIFVCEIQSRYENVFCMGAACLSVCLLLAVLQCV